MSRCKHKRFKPVTIGIYMCSCYKTRHEVALELKVKRLRAELDKYKEVITLVD